MTVHVTVFAGVQTDGSQALLALDFAAPAELAVALVHALHGGRIVATPTAHDVTSVGTLRRLVTLSAGGSERTCNQQNTVLRQFLGIESLSSFRGVDGEHRCVR